MKENLDRKKKKKKRAVIAVIRVVVNGGNVNVTNWKKASENE